MTDNVPVLFSADTARYLIDEALGGFVSKALDSVQSTIDEAIQKHIEATLVATTEEIITSRIAAAVDAVLEEGWQRTNAYGEKMGPAIGIKERISEMLLKPDQLASDYDSRTRIDKAIESAVERTMRDHLAGPIAAARKKYEELVDQKAIAAFGSLLRKAVAAEAQS